MSWKNVNFHNKVTHCLAPHAINVPDFFVLDGKCFSIIYFCILGCSAYLNKSFDVFLLKKRVLILKNVIFFG